MIILRLEPPAAIIAMIAFLSQSLAPGLLIAFLRQLRAANWKFEIINGFRNLLELFENGQRLSASSAHMKKKGGNSNIQQQFFAR
jgi:hypothetical protein